MFTEILRRFFIAKNEFQGPGDKAGDKFIGQFVDGQVIFQSLLASFCKNELLNFFYQFEGEGEYFFSNGDRYEGSFSGGSRHGQV